MASVDRRAHDGDASAAAAVADGMRRGVVQWENQLVGIAAEAPAKEPWGAGPLLAAGPAWPGTTDAHGYYPMPST